MKVYVLSVNSESGDTMPPTVFRKKLSEEDLEKFLREQYPDEFVGDDGPGEFGSYLYTEWEECEVL
jgi:hypothetical protein